MKGLKEYFINKDNVDGKYLLELLKLKRLTINEKMEEIELSNTAGEYVKWYNYFGNQFGIFPKKVQNISTVRFRYFTPKYFSKRNESLQRLVHKCS